MKRLLIAAATLLALSAPVVAAPAAYAAEPDTNNFQYIPGDDSCMIKYPRTDGLIMSYMLLKNGLLVAGVVRDKWDIVNGQDANVMTHKITFDYGNGVSTTANIGGYLNAEVQGIYGVWQSDNTGAGSTDEALSTLSKGQVATVSFDGKVIGTFDMKMKGFAASLLKTCMADIKKKG